MAKYGKYSRFRSYPSGLLRSGDVFRLWLPGRSLIILGSHDVATELLDERGAKYSSRPGFPLFEMSVFSSQEGMALICA